MPPSGLSQLPLTLTVALVAAIAVALTSRKHPALPRLLLPPAAFLTTLALAQSLLVYANTTWNSVRAVVPVAMAHGVPPVFPPGEGPLWAAIYPPLAYVLQLPISLLPTPQSVVHAGQLHGLLLLALPLTFLLRQHGGPATSLAAVIAAALVVHLPGLTGAALTVHVDPAAIAFALGACLPLLRPTLTPRAALLSGALTAASILCKQTMVPLAVLLPLVLALTGHRRPAAFFLLGLFAATAVLLAAFLSFLSPAGLWNNTFRVPSAHPWRDDTPTPLRHAAAKAFASLWTLWLIVPALWWARRFPPSPVRPSARPHLLLLLAAVALLLTGIAGYAKFGGHLNNFAPTGFFLLAATMLLLSSLPSDRLARIVMPLLLILASAAMLARLHDIHRLGPRPALHNEALALVRTAPGRIYLPWHPLAHFLAERRLTHQSFGVLDREMAGQPISDAWLWQYLPPDTELLGFDFPPRLPPDPMADRLFERLRPRFPLPAEVPGFPGWTFYAKEPP